MKKFLLTVLSIFCILGAVYSQSKTIDTLVDVGNHKIHFKIVKGKGTPILFEAGAGSNTSVWNSILQPISAITAATLITYDRAGFGTSTIDSLQTDTSKHGIISNIQDLEIGLKKLGYNKDIMLVSHSYGGYLSTLYAARNPKLVKAVVLIDVNHNYFEDGYIEKIVRTQDKLIPEWKKNNKGIYYMSQTIEATVKLMSTLSIPQNIPVIDFQNGIPFLKTTEEIERWKDCHTKFAANNPNCTSITAYGCHHGIWLDNPALIISTISKTYTETLKGNKKLQGYKRSLNYAINASNEEKKEQLSYNNSEADLNNWGYELLRKNENEKAAEVLKLNMILNPSSANAYDSYAEALLKINKKDEAIAMYKKAVSLNPENKNSKEVLQRLLKETTK
jgi:hypothetical protein